MSHENGRELDRMAARLAAGRPVPAPGFRGELRRRLMSTAGGVPPRRLRRLIAAYATSGAVLLVVVAVGVAGVGPLAA